MAQTLSNLTIREVSLVDRPANSEIDPLTGKKIPRARVAIYKHDDSEGGDQERLAKAAAALEEELSKAVEGKTQEGTTFPKGDFAYTPDDVPSHWKLRLTSVPGGKPDAAIVGAAVAALGKGFRGNVVQIPGGALTGVKSKVRAAWHTANPDKGDTELPPVLKGDSTVTIEQIEKRQEDQEATLAVLKASNDVLKAEADLAKAESALVIKMSKKDRKLYALMDPEKRKEFMSADEQTKMDMLEACDKVNKPKKGAADDEPDADDEMEKRIQKMDSDNKTRQSELTARITKAETELVETRKREQLVNFTKMAETELPHTAGKPEEKGAMLLGLATSMGGTESPVFKQYVATLKAADTALAIHFGEVGKSGADSVPAEAALDVKCEEIMKRDKIDRPHAMDKALTENPALYFDYERQHRAASAPTGMGY